MRLEGYEVIEQWPDNTWLARDADGSLVELVAFIVRENERGEATQRLTRIRKLAHPSLPRVIAIEGDPSVRGELIVVTEHRPRVTLERCAAAASDVGLAVALVCTIACAVARALAELHAARIVHGRVRAACIGISADGAASLDLPRLVRTREPRNDVDDLVQLICTTIAPSTPETQLDELEVELDESYDGDEYAGEHDAVVAPPAAQRSAIESLVAKRPDVPLELIDIMRSTQGDEPLDARGFAETLVRALPWTQWTQQNVVDEVRALLPDLA